MSIENLTVLIKGGCEIASGIAHQLTKSHFNVCLTEISKPLSVRREVSFCEAIHTGEKTIEGITAKLVETYEEIPRAWNNNKIPIIIDPETRIREFLKPAILVDAIMAKKNLGTKITDAPLVIALGPGFYAGKDAHLVVETKRGHNLGKVIVDGEAEKNTGIPTVISGFSFERVLRAPRAGRLSTLKDIGDYVKMGEVLAIVDDSPVKAEINGIIRGLLRSGSKVSKGMKTGDIDPRGIKEYCYTISDKARAIAGGVLEGILSHFNE